MVISRRDDIRPRPLLLSGNGVGFVSVVNRVYSVASAVDSDCGRTAPRHCYEGSTQQSLYVCKSADYPRNAAGNDVRV